MSEKENDLLLPDPEGDGDWYHAAPARGPKLPTPPLSVEEAIKQVVTDEEDKEVDWDPEEQGSGGR